MDTSKKIIGGSTLLDNIKRITRRHMRLIVSALLFGALTLLLFYFVRINAADSAHEFSQSAPLEVHATSKTMSGDNLRESVRVDQAASPPLPPIAVRPAESAYEGVYFSGKKVGPEGLAYHIQSALTSTNSQDALEAAKAIARCGKINHEVEQALAYRSQVTGAKYPEGVRSLIEREMSMQRACQSLDESLSGARSLLLYKAMQGGERGAAFEYLAYLSVEDWNSQTRRGPVVEQLKRDADSGHFASMMFLGSGDERVGLARFEERAYREAFRWAAPLDNAEPPGAVAAIKNMLDIFSAGEPELSAEEQKRFEVKLGELKRAISRRQQGG